MENKFLRSAYSAGQNTSHKIKRKDSHSSVIWDCQPDLESTDLSFCLHVRGVLWNRCPQMHTHALYMYICVCSPYTVANCLIFWSYKAAHQKYLLIYNPLNMNYAVTIKLLKLDVITPITIAPCYIMGRRHYMSSCEALENYPREKF